MKIKHITKPQLIDFLRWLDKNKHIHPFRIRYSSFRSKKVMLQEFSKFYDVDETTTHYNFVLRPHYHFLVAPRHFQFSKGNFHFLLGGDVIDLNSLPSPPEFRIRYGRFLIEI